MREARYSSTNYGALSLLANVYDLSFSFQNRAANTVLFPGVILNFVLVDWDYNGQENSPYEALKNASYNYTTVFGDSNPHDGDKIAHLLGLGGYFIISQVKYILGQTSQDFEIQVSCKFNGMDGSKGVRDGAEDRTGAADGDQSSEKNEEIVKPSQEATKEPDDASTKPTEADETDDGEKDSPDESFPTNGTVNREIAKGVTLQMTTQNGPRDEEKEYGKLLFDVDIVGFTNDFTVLEGYAKLTQTRDVEFDEAKQREKMGVTIKQLMEARASLNRLADAAEVSHQSFVTKGFIKYDAGSGEEHDDFFMYYNANSKVLTVRYYNE